MRPATRLRSAALAVAATWLGAGSDGVAEAPVRPRGAETVPAPTETVAPRVPPGFLENRGQVEGPATHYLRSADTTVFLAPDRAVLVRTDPRRPGERVALELRFLGARADVVPAGEHPLAFRTNLLRGARAEWRTGLRSYRRVVYRDLWPGVDLAFLADGTSVAYELRVAPGADPAAARFEWLGADREVLTDEGALRLETRVGRVEDAAPCAFQAAADGGRERVDVAFRLAPAGPDGSGRRWSFRVGPHDPSRELVIDPAVLVYATFLGGSGEDWPACVAADGAGAAYVGGYTTSPAPGFPTGPGLQTEHAGGSSDSDGFLAKFDRLGEPVYVTFLGSTAGDAVWDLAVDGAGGVTAVGSAGDGVLPFPAAAGGVAGSGAFLAELTPAGDDLVRVLFPLGIAGSTLYGVALAEDGAAHVVGVAGDGVTEIGGPGRGYGGGLEDAVVARIERSGEVTRRWYLGGEQSDVARDVAVSPSGRVLLCGDTASTDATFPVRGTFGQRYGGGSRDAFVAGLTPDGQDLAFCGLLGGDDLEIGKGLHVDDGGEIAVAGWTRSSAATFPASGPGLTGKGPGAAGFVAKLDAEGAALRWASYVASYVEGLTGDGAGNVVVTGHANFLAYVAELDTAGVQTDFQVVGTSTTTNGHAVALGTDGRLHLVGLTERDERTFPVTDGAFDTTFGGGQYDGFLIQLGGQAPAPHAFEAAPVPPTAVRLTWTTPVPDLAGYEVLRAGPDGGFELVATLPWDAVEYLDEGLAAFTTYTYRVRSFDAAGAPGRLAQVHVTTLPTLTLRVRRGRVSDAAEPGGDRFVVRGRIRVAPEARGRAIDPPSALLLVELGAEAAPFRWAIPEHDVGWSGERRSARPAARRSVWRGAGGGNLGTGAVVLDLRRRRFRLAFSGISFPGPQANPLRLTLRVGDDAGTDEFRWTLRRKRRPR